ncbi:uncharacterized protein RMCC_5166 [Mycolicibacterium canariasense]|uniref:Uncharacterized protein n=1 Tax=Mycolicibacterium canariasense TaxID=228230 RepID=A0A100WHC3_MYCCR|nr:hypothetical protein [Mycolicibacterium canariasense]MCV7210594.1 hypothetical protein [Mycolicibacterium canariasense]ORU96064.1 hypothetical protein AWB94_31280 [Mycolicibacterium canariasense]GAS98201.1 uncharacterized protein RMCC_5166 [Mycolicibacterium canariasense]
MTTQLNSKILYAGQTLMTNAEGATSIALAVSESAKDGEARVVTVIDGTSKVTLMISPAIPIVIVANA